MTRSTTPAITLRALRPPTGPRASRISSARTATVDAASRRAGPETGRSDRAVEQAHAGLRRVAVLALDVAGKTLRTPSERVPVRLAPRREHVERRPLVDDPPVLEQEEREPERDRLGGAVGDVKHGDRLGGLDRAEPLDQGVAARQVERRDRLVAEQEPRARRQRPGQPDALPLAAGERRRPPVQKRLDAAERRHLGAPAVGLRPGPALQAEPDVRRDVRWGKSRSSWKTMPTRREPERPVDPRRGVEERLARRAGRIPRSGVRRPAISRRRVVLPAPEGPNTTPHSRPS